MQGVRMNSCRAGLHREPLKSTPFAYQHVKRSSGMHLKPYHKLQKKDFFLEIRSNRGMHLNTQGSAKEEKYNGSTKNFSPSTESQTRKPLGAISQNTMCNTVENGATKNFESTSKNAPTVVIHQGEEGDGSLDICAIIKPGNTKEKIAFFAAHHSSNNRNNSMKMKSTGDMNGRAAKRRKKSVDLKRFKSQLEKMQEAHKKCFPPETFQNRVENCSVNFFTEGDGILPGRPLSVIEMVAFLEQRANALLSAKPTNTSRFSGTTSKCALPATVSFLALRTCEEQTDKESSEKSEQLESVCVLEMVAKLESECLRRQNERDSCGLSRSNSFRRNVGRMLLASGSQADLNSSQNLPTRSSENVENVEASAMEQNMPQNMEDHSGVKSWDRSAHIKPKGAECLPHSEDTSVTNADIVRETYIHKRNMGDVAVSLEPSTFSFSLCINAVECAPESFGTIALNVCAAEENEESFDSCFDSSIQTADILIHTFSNNETESPQDRAFILARDPFPGTLFFQRDENGQNRAHVHINSELKSQTEITEIDELGNALCIQNSSLIAQYAISVSSANSESQVLDTSVKRQVSHDFLETRFKIQQLLEPQQYMAFLPHHILVKIFRFLPTRTLAALKCTSCYFRFIIEHYDIRPCDSLWVRDPRYKDDPCKQCKKKYAKGDVSLCWWHPKPYCQALPYGPGYWMCCHMSYKESRGCKVGLHDNRWVPACHSFNRTICKKSKESELEED